MITRGRNPMRILESYCRDKLFNGADSKQVLEQFFHRGGLGAAVVLKNYCMLPATIGNGNFIAQKIRANVSLYNGRQVEKFAISNDPLHLLTDGQLALGRVECGSSSLTSPANPPDCLTTMVIIAPRVKKTWRTDYPPGLLPYAFHCHQAAWPSRRGITGVDNDFSEGLDLFFLQSVPAAVLGMLHGAAAAPTILHRSRHVYNGRGQPRIRRHIRVSGVAETTTSRTVKRLRMKLRY